MAVNQLIAPHDYFFDKECHVNRDTLHPLTLESRELSNFNYRRNRRGYIYETYEVVHTTQEGLPYAHFWRPGDSSTDVVLIMNPFGTPIKPRHSAEAMAAYIEDREAAEVPEGVEPNDANKLLQGRFLYDTLKLAGLTDPEGNHLPVLVITAPSLDHTSPLDKKGRQAVIKGDFSPFARRALEIVRRAGYQRIYAAGYSLGTIAASAVRLAGKEGIDVLAGCYVGDAPNFKTRRPRKPLPLRILFPYALDSFGLDYQGPWIADGPEPRLDIARNGESYNAVGHWFGNGNFLVNRAIGIGLSIKQLPDTLDYMKRHKIPTTISWSESRLMRGFESFINQDVSAEQLAHDGLLRLFCARKAPHISGENQVFLTDVMLRSIIFARECQTA